MKAMEAVWPSSCGAGLVIWWSWVQVVHPATRWNCSRSLRAQTPWLKFVYNRLVCFRPEETPNVYLVYIGPEKPHRGSGQLMLLPPKPESGEALFKPPGMGRNEK